MCVDDGRLVGMGMRCRKGPGIGDRQETEG